jgi:hypothetical protein
VTDRKKVSEKNGVHRTNRVTVGPGYFLAPGYEFAETDEKEISDTGRVKIFRVYPSDEQSAGLRFLGRWDDGPAQCLDIDLVDRNDRVLRGPYGHHSKAQAIPGHRRFEVSVGLDEANIVFRGVVELALGFRVHLGAVARERSL